MIGVIDAGSCELNQIEKRHHRRRVIERTFAEKGPCLILRSFLCRLFANFAIDRASLRGAETRVW